MKWPLAVLLAVAFAGCAATQMSRPYSSAAPAPVAAPQQDEPRHDSCDDDCKRRRKEELERLSSIGQNPRG